VPKNEDGEFELILANRQLLSVFFIVVVLLGVFFTMGYIVGRNSGPAQVDVASAHKPESKPIVVDSPARPETPAPAPETPKSTQPQQPPPEATKPEQKPEPVAKQESPARKEAAKSEKSKAEKASSSQPVSGSMYLQLVATAKAEADVMVDVLHQKKFKAIAMEIPEKPGTFRVLVGPLPDGSLNKTKSDLQSSGFPGDKAIKKVF
jgi:hypothetical protein